MVKAATIPIRYMQSMMPALAHPDAIGMSTAIIKVYTGMRAEQLMSGATRIVTRRSLRFSMVRVAMMPGMAQAKLLSIGMNDFPCRPAFDMRRSMMNAARAM